MATLKYEANSSLQTVTLGSAYTSGSGSMTLTAGHGARLPASGDYWITYNNGAGIVRIYKVTSRSTDTLTVVADATEGSGDGNISSGETLRWALTVSALTQLRADIVAETGLQYITQQTASSSSALNFTSVLTSTFRGYLLLIEELVPATDGAEIQLQVSTDNGSTYVTSSSYQYTNHLASPTAAAVVGSASNTSIVLAFNQSADTALYGFSGQVNIVNPLGTSLRKTIYGNGILYTSADVPQVVNFMGVYAATTAVNAFRIIASSGNLTSGVVTLFGYRKS